MILVTGGTGLVGARLLYELAVEGKTVRALKRTHSSLAAFEFWIKNEPALATNIQWIDGDVLDIESLQEALKGVTQVFHCAALISTDPKDAAMMEAVNVQGTANIVNLCLDNPMLTYFCHVSSVAALGRVPEESMFDENSHWQSGKHNSTYAISKYGAEREVWRGIAEGLPASIVIPSIILGPGNWRQGSCRLFPMIHNGFRFYSQGVSGYVDVRDVTHIMRKLAQKNCIGERFLLNAENVSYKLLFQQMATALGVQQPSIAITPWISEVAWRVASVSSKITGKSTLITKNYARASQLINQYKNDKIRELLNYDFISVSDSVKFSSAAYLAQI